jgi:hypothetical protein
MVEIWWQYKWMFLLHTLFFYTAHSGGWSPNWVHSAPRPFTVLLYLPRVIVRMENFRWNENWQGKPKYSGKTCPSATLFTTNPTWPDPGSNPGRRGGKPATNRWSYGAAIYLHSLHQLVRPYASREQVHVFLAGTSSCPAWVATSSLLQLSCCHLQSEFRAKHL